MIHSARPTVSPVANNIVFDWNLFCFVKSGDVRTDGKDVRKQWSLPAVTVGRPSGSIFECVSKREVFSGIFLWSSELIFFLHIFLPPSCFVPLYKCMYTLIFFWRVVCSRGLYYLQEIRNTTCLQFWQISYFLPTKKAKVISPMLVKFLQSASCKSVLLRFSCWHKSLWSVRSGQEKLAISMPIFMPFSALKIEVNI